MECLLVQIIKVMKHMMTERKWWHLPRYAFGSSSGGCIALELALRFPLQASPPTRSTCSTTDLAHTGHVMGAWRRPTWGRNDTDWQLSVSLAE